jgi:hypothetical protein
MASRLGHQLLRSCHIMLLAFERDGILQLNMGGNAPHQAMQLQATALTSQVTVYHESTSSYRSYPT